MGVPKASYREILISDYITKESVKDVIKEIMKINSEDKKNIEEYGDKYEVEPIKLFINSFGGSVYDGLALVDTINKSETPVHTITIGSAMSMGLWIFMSGHKRFVGGNATLMYHEVAGYCWDKLESMKLKVEELERIQIKLDFIVVSKTKATQEQLDDYRNRKAEWYISSGDAISLGFGELY